MHKRVEETVPGDNKYREFPRRFSHGIPPRPKPTVQPRQKITIDLIIEPDAATEP